MMKLYPDFPAFCLPITKKLFALGVIGLLGLASHGAAAATIRWDGGNGTAAWGDAANWAPDGVPTSADDVILDNTYVSGGYTVTLSGLNRAARSLQIGYTGNVNSVILRITGGGSGDNLRLGGAPGFDLVIADGGTLHNLSTVSGAGNRGVEFIDGTTDSWRMTGTGTYLHEQANGSFLNVSGANVSFAATSAFEVRSGLSTTWGGASGGLSYIKRYGNLRFNPTLAANTTFNFHDATDSVLVTGDLGLFNSLLTVQLTGNNTNVRVHVLGNVTVNNAKLYASAGAGNGVLVIDGNLTTGGTQARVGAAAGAGNQGVLTVGGNFNAYYVASSNNELLSFWRSGSSTVGTWQPVSGSTFRDVDIRKSVQLLGAVNLATNGSNLRVRNTGTLDFNGFNVTGLGRFTLLNNGTIKITSEDGISNSAPLGNVRVSGTRNFSPGANYWYTGASFQVTGDGLPATVSSLRLVKSSAALQVELTNPVTVNSNLTLTLGQLLIGNNNLVMGPSATLSGGSANAYVRTDSNPTATGALVRQVVNNAADVLFPIGTSTYTPALLAQTAGATTDNFSVRVFDGVYSEGTSGTPITNRVVDRTWMVDEAVAGGANATLTLQWNITDEGENFTRTSTRIRHYTGGAYDETMTEVPAQGSDPYKLSRSGLTSFSPFAIGSTPVLPVELTRFNARRMAASAQLTWATASERNCDYFEIQRSATGFTKDFVKIGRVNGNGTTFTPNEYTFTDNQLPQAAMAYYRLRQVDRDGSSHYSNVQAVRLTKDANVQLTLFPNPVTDQLSLGVPTTGGTLTVRNVIGREMLRQTVTSTESAVVLSVGALPVGSYIVDFQSEQGERFTKSFLKQ